MTERPSTIAWASLLADVGGTNVRFALLMGGVLGRSNAAVRG
jgi:glucokinase